MKTRCCINCASNIAHPTDNSLTVMVSCNATGGMLVPSTWAALRTVRDEITLPCFVKEGK